LAEHGFQRQSQARWFPGLIFGERWAGCAADVTMRLMGQWLSERFGQPFIIENKPGAASNIATEAVVHASPDGYMLLMVGLFNAINATLFDKLSFHFTRDITPVASVIRLANVLVVNQSVPANTVPELIAYARANPRKLNMASPGIGSPSHVSGELFKPEAQGAPEQPVAHGGRQELHCFMAAAAGANHDAHRPCGIGLRPCNARRGRQRGSARCQMQESAAGKFHDVASLISACRARIERENACEQTAKSKVRGRRLPTASPLPLQKQDLGTSGWQLRDKATSLSQA
jgi:hypothetical protein